MRCTASVLLLVASACAVEVGVPSDAQIHCDATADCPEGWVCVEGVQRCVAAELAAEEGPALDGAPTLTPPVGTIGTTFTSTFAVTKELAEDPVVTFDAGARRAPMVKDDAASAPPAYVYRYTADGSEAAGSHDVTINLVDRLANRAEGLSAGSITFDFAPPLVITHALVPERTTRTAPATLTFTLDEPTRVVPVVTMDAGAGPLAWTLTDTSGTNRYEFSYTPGASDIAGDYVVTIVGEDLATNVGDPFDAGTLVLDFDAPAITRINIAPTVARAGQAVVVRVTCDEAPAGTPTVELRPTAGAAIVLGSPQVDGTDLTFLHEVEVGQDGIYEPFLLGLTDEAGNILADTSLSQPVTIDTVAPGFDSYSQNGDTFLATDTLQVTFTATEPLLEVPEVKLRDVLLAWQSGAGAGPYVYTLDIATAGISGTWQVYVTLTDLAGNLAFLSQGTAGLDTEPPQLVDVRFSPAQAKLNTTALLTITVNEDLGDTLDVSNLTFDTNPGFAFASRSGVNYIFSLDVDSGVPEGTYQLTAIAVADAAGNPATFTTTHPELPATFSVDNLPPSVSRCGADPESPVMSGDTVRVSFITEDNLSTPPVVTIGDITVTTQVAADPACSPGAGEAAYTFSYPVLGTEDGGAQGVTVQVTDGAGNVAAAGLGVVVFDFTQPDLRTGVTVAPVVAASASLVTLLIQPNEPLGIEPQVTVAGLTGTVSCTETGVDWLCQLTGTLAAGDHAVDVRLEDEAGNPRNLTDVATVVIDTTAPQIVMDSPGVVAPTTFGATLYANLDDRTNGRVITISFEVLDDNLTAGIPPVVQVGAGAAICPIGWPVAGGERFDCDYALDGTESSGVQVITIRATDDAGNAAALSSANAGGPLTVTYDFDLPTVAFATYALSGGGANPLADGDLTHVTWDTFVLLDLSPTEPVRIAAPDAPVLTVSNGAVEPFVIVENGPFAETGPFSYDLVLDGAASPSQGTYAVRLAMTDRAGNPNTDTATLSGNGVSVDTAAPAVPDTSVAGNITFTRIPWGADDLVDDSRDGVPLFTVVGKSGVAEASTTAIVYASADVATAIEAGRGVTGSAGDIPEIELTRVDRRAVYLSTVDGAGNQSDDDGNSTNGIQATLVRDIEWVATIGGKVAGRDYENPHSVYQSTHLVRERADGALLGPRRDPGITELGDASPLFLIGGANIQTQETPRWSLRGPFDTGRPSARERHAMVYDSVRERIVMFGGNDGSTSDQLWEWDGDEWIQMCGQGTVCAGPGFDVNFHMAFDSARGRTVLHNRNNETWEWDGTRWEEKCTAAPCVKPGTPTEPAMAYDRARGQVLMLARNKPLWAWDGVQWTQVCGGTTGCTNVGRYDSHAMAYDATRQVVVLFGGRSSSSSGYLDDTWEWNGARWEEKCTTSPCVDAGNHPAARGLHKMAYDDARGRIVLVGGTTGGNETWEWDGTTWTLACGGATACTGVSRLRAALAYDRARGISVLFGGYASGDHDETFVWDGTSWREACAINGTCVMPSQRSDTALAFDPVRRVAVMFGGDQGGGTYLDDTWLWNGYGWSQACTTPPCSTVGSHPSTREDVAMVAGNGVIYLFGGEDESGDCGTGVEYCNDLWQWDGADWTKVCGSGTACTGPSPRQDTALAWDSDRNRLVLFGGGDGPSTADGLEDTWEWNGSSWLQRCTSAPCSTAGNHPSSRYSHAMAYDSSRQRVVLLGGEGLGEDETWEWNGAAGTWAELCTTSPCVDYGNHPDFRQRHGMVFDPDRGRVLLFGGYRISSSYYHDTWEWDGAAWHLLCDGSGACGSPSDRGGFGMTYDTDRDTVVMFGGGPGSWSNEVWELQSRGASRPGHIFTIDYAQANGPDTAVCRTNPTRCELLSATVDWYAGGTGGAGDGADLLAWQGGTWEVLASNTDAFGSPDAVSWSTSSGAEIGWPFAGDLAPELHLAVTPSDGTTGAIDAAAVSSDYVEVRLRYRSVGSFTDLLADDFATGADPSVWSALAGTAAASTAQVYSDTQSLVLSGAGGTATTVPVDTSGCAFVVWKYYGKRGPDRPEVADRLRVQYFDGTSWNNTDTWAGGVVDPAFTIRVGQILDGAAMHPTFQLRLVSNGSAGDFDHFFVDDFLLVCAAD